MTMRERMARAAYIANSRYHTGGYMGGGPVVPWENLSEIYRPEWYAQADAALDALMEPTERMADAGGRQIAAEIHGIKGALTLREYARDDVMQGYADYADAGFRGMIRAIREQDA